MTVQIVSKMKYGNDDVGEDLPHRRAFGGPDLAK